MTLLTWDEPPKAEPYEEWAKYQADGAPPGTYAPNMSPEWMARWKARMRGQRSEGLSRLRTEIRKTVTEGYRSAQVLLIVWPGGEVTVSMNGRAPFSAASWAELQEAVSEAIAAMQAHKAQEGTS